MMVEVDTAQIHALESRVEQLGGLLTAVLRKQKTKTVTLSPDDLGTGRVTIDVTDDGIVLEYHTE